MFTLPKATIQCPYKEKCIDVGKECCSRCANNEKRSYYRPVDYWPYYPQPYYPYWPTVTTGTHDDDWTVTCDTASQRTPTQSYFEGQ